VGGGTILEPIVAPLVPPPPSAPSPPDGVCACASSALDGVEVWSRGSRGSPHYPTKWTPGRRREDGNPTTESVPPGPTFVVGGGDYPGGVGSSGPTPTIRPIPPSRRRGVRAALGAAPHRLRRDRPAPGAPPQARRTPVVGHPTGRWSPDSIPFYSRSLYFIRFTGDATFLVYFTWEVFGLFLERVHYLGGGVEFTVVV